jgi:hypothetical protein
VNTVINIGNLERKFMQAQLKPMSRVLQERQRVSDHYNEDDLSSTRCFETPPVKFKI